MSVAMATYNGANWITEQLDSILAELGPDDEVVVVDDGSRDGTADIVASQGDPRVRLIRSEHNTGYVRAFERALRTTTRDVVLLADQDDVWLPGRRDAMVAALRDHEVVASNVVILGEDRGLRGPLGQEDWRLRTSDQHRHRANVAGILAGIRPYYGCAMGIRREVLDGALPFPDYLIESHDLWLAIYGNLRRSIAHLEQPTLQRRVHADNATPESPRGVRQAAQSRLMLARAVVDLRRRAAAAPRP